MHTEAFAFARGVLAKLPLEDMSVLEIGSREINGSARELFEQVRAYVGIDIAPGPGVDIVADGSTFVPLSQPDLVVCMETLEHTDRACGIVHNAAQMLSPGGRMLVTCATDPRAAHSGVDGGPVRPGEFYRNVPPDQLVQWIEQAGLQMLYRETHFSRGDLYVLAAKP